MGVNGGYRLRPIKVTIDIDPQKIPELVCCDYSAHADTSAQQVALAVAKTLGIEDYLSQPERIYELRRWMWEKGDTLTLLPQATEETVPLEMSAD